MIILRMANDAEHPCFSVKCDSITEAMYCTHVFVWRGNNDKRIAHIIDTNVSWWKLCDIDYTRNGSANADCMTDKTFERFFQTTL